jgi:hypothetical protein
MRYNATAAPTDGQSEDTAALRVGLAAFEAWCAGQGRVMLPADPTTVAAFLAAGAQILSAGALGRRAAAR